MDSLFLRLRYLYFHKLSITIMINCKSVTNTRRDLIVYFVQGQQRK